jgi:hypothetical protein
MSEGENEDPPPAKPIVKQPWETPRVVESAIKDNTGYTSNDDVVHS